MNVLEDQRVVVGSRFTPSKEWLERDYKPTYSQFYKPRQVFRDERIPVNMDIEDFTDDEQ